MEVGEFIPVKIQTKAIAIFNCSNVRNLSLDDIQTSDRNFLLAGDFNSLS